MLNKESGEGRDAKKESNEDEKVDFVYKIPFFRHWYKKKLKALLANSKTRKTVRG